MYFNYILSVVIISCLASLYTFTLMFLCIVLVYAHITRFPLMINL